jgi:hypothetical protein
MMTFTLHSNFLFSQKSCVWMLAPDRRKINKIWRPPLCSQGYCTELESRKKHGVWGPMSGGGGGEVRVRKDTWEIYDLQILLQSSPPLPAPREMARGVDLIFAGGGGWRGFWRIEISIRMYIVHCTVTSVGCHHETVRNKTSLKYPKGGPALSIFL